MSLLSRTATSVALSFTILNHGQIGLLNTFLLAFTNSLIFASAQSTNSPDCSCYTISGGSPPTYFIYHSFHDFRSITPSSSDDFDLPPPLLLESQVNDTAPATSSFFTSATFKNDWAIQSWTQAASSDAPVKLVNSPQNVYIEHSNLTSRSTHLTLRTTRLSTFQSAAEIDSNLITLMHASIRIRARISGSPGAVAGLFTFADNTDESDIEILTRDPDTQFRATNQPSVDSQGSIPDASRAVAIPANVDGKGGGGNGTWNEWTTYRLDWLPTHTSFWANNISLSNNTYSVPRKPSQFIMNMWGNGGVWSGNMRVGQEATLDVEWVEMVYNTSDGGAGMEKRAGDWQVEEESEKKRRKRPKAPRNVVCSVDAETVAGTPVVVGGGIRDRVGSGWALGIALFWGALMVM